MDKEIFDKAASIRQRIEGAKRFDKLAEVIINKRNDDVLDYAHVLEIMQLCDGLRRTIYDYAFKLLQLYYDTDTALIEQLEEKFKNL